MNAHGCPAWVAAARRGSGERVGGRRDASGARAGGGRSGTYGTNRGREPGRARRAGERVGACEEREAERGSGSASAWSKRDARPREVKRSTLRPARAVYSRLRPASASGSAMVVLSGVAHHIRRHCTANGKNKDYRSRAAHRMESQGIDDFVSGFERHRGIESLVCHWRCDGVDW